VWRLISDLLADIGPRPLLSVGPDTTMLEAVRKLCLYHVHRMPVVDAESGNLLCLLTHKRLLHFLYNFVSPPLRTLSDIVVYSKICAP